MRFGITLTLMTCLVVGCTPKTESTKVTIAIPLMPGASSKTISQSVQASSGSSWGLAAPSSISEIKCFGILVGGPTSELSKRTCVSSNGSSFPVGFAAGLVSPGQNLSINVSSGPKRVFTLVGFNISSGQTCETFVDRERPSLNNSIHSPPMILGRVTADLRPGDNSLTLNASLTGEQIQDCNFEDTSGGNTINIGTGADGDVTISTAASLSSTMNQGATRYLSTTTRVTGLTPASSPLEFAVNLASSATAAHFAVGDEISLYIAAEGTSTGCGTDTNNKVFPGFAIQGAVTVSASGPLLYATFDDARVAQIPSANLNASGIQGFTFCRAIVTRVPNLQNLTLNTGAAVSVPQFGSLSDVHHLGGIIKMRVRGTLTAAGSSAISATGLGFAASASAGAQGDGIEGGGGTSTIAANANGGAAGVTSTIGAGGGAHGGNGSIGSASASPAALPTSDQYGCSNGAYDALGRCLMGKIYLGGSGGTNAVAASGHGGGIIDIVADQMNIASGTLSMTAAGADGNSSGAGGAGGAILIRTRSLAAAGTLFIVASGGHGYAGGATNGGGAGGRVHVDVLETCSATPITVAVSAGSLGTTPAQVGTFHKTGAGASSGGCMLP